MTECAKGGDYLIHFNMQNKRVMVSIKQIAVCNWITRWPEPNGEHEEEVEKKKKTGQVKIIGDRLCWNNNQFYGIHKSPEVLPFACRSTRSSSSSPLLLLVIIIGP